MTALPTHYFRKQMEKEISINGKKFKLREMLYLDIIELPGITDRKKHALKVLELSGLSEADALGLNAKEGEFIMQEINNLNGWISDFQKTSKKEEKN